MLNKETAFPVYVQQLMNIEHDKKLMNLFTINKHCIA
jgi:hypothetical protein